MDSSLSGWYWGNIVFGGLIGMLIVDPATGAMYKLPEGVSADMGTPVAQSNQASDLKIVMVEALSAESRAQMIKIN